MSTNKKYELLEDDFIEYDGKRLYRIKSLKDFGYIKKDDLGGYIESENNLSHTGNSWVSGNAVVKENYHVKYGRTTTDLSLDLISNIESQTGLKSFNKEVYCYKHVRKDLSSLHDNNFKYKINEWIEVLDPDLSNSSCSSGLHVSNAQYWNGNAGEEILFCKVKLEDIITVQEGKIRCKKLFVIGICDGIVY